jgi:hypothetical protein
MSKDTFFAQLQDVIETTTARLIMEGEHELASKGIVRQ